MPITTFWYPENWIGAGLLVAVLSIGSLRQSSEPYDGGGAAEFCSFCRVKQQELSVLHRWSGCISDECIRTSLEILAGDGSRPPKIIESQAEAMMLGGTLY